VPMFVALVPMFVALVPMFVVTHPEFVCKTPVQVAVLTTATCKMAVLLACVTQVANIQAMFLAGLLKAVAWIPTKSRSTIFHPEKTTTPVRSSNKSTAPLAPPAAPHSPLFRQE
ncbi:MAG TPA: hypothetical protein PLM41_16515, partial [Saprospiraceae bacterium]|nr:hypothetical protein [Saprospiraceae bacterium]